MLKIAVLLGIVIASLFTNALCENKDGGKAPRLSLNDGNSIPSLGIGTFLGFDENGQKKVKKGEVEDAVTWALDAGYRLIDTATVYNTEEEIGKALRKTQVPRESIFVVTKLASHQQRHGVPALKRSLRLMNLTYVDLYLIHTPMGFSQERSTYDPVDYLDTWKSMEEAKQLGLAKSIGVSNFNISQIERLLDNCEVKPSVLQVEMNLNLGQNKVVDFCKDHGMVVMAYTPFGSLFGRNPDAPPPRVDDPTLMEIAKKYGKSTPQIALRYLLQRGVVPIPKSVNKARIEQNIDVFDFELAPEDMDTLSKYNKDYRTVITSFWQDHPYYPYEKIDTPAPDPFKPSKKEPKASE